TTTRAPRHASSMDDGSFRSPVTIEAPRLFRRAIFSGLDVVRTRARTERPPSARIRQISPPTRPVAPTIKVVIDHLPFTNPAGSLRWRKHARHVRRHPAGKLPPQERRRNQTRRVEFIHEALHGESIAELLPARRQQHLDLDLSREIARAVRGLLQVQVLFGADRVGVEPEPAARR